MFFRYMCVSQSVKSNNDCLYRKQILDCFFYINKPVATATRDQSIVNGRQQFVSYKSAIK